jgi:hypothetical protein
MVPDSATATTHLKEEKPTVTDETMQPGTFGHHWVTASKQSVPAVLPAIQDLVWRYALAIDSKDVALVAELFSATSSFGRWGEGPEGAAAYYRAIWRRFRRSIHSVTNIVLTPVDEHHLRGIVYCRSERELPSVGWQLQQFAYFDDYVLEDGAWRFLRRNPRFWYRDSGGVRHDRDEMQNDDPNDGPHLPRAWNSWAAYWEVGTGTD